MNPLHFLLVCCAGWMNRHQQVVIEYLQAEIRVLKEQLGTIVGPKGSYPLLLDSGFYWLSLFV